MESRTDPVPDAAPRVMLTLAFPASLEETIVDHLLEHPEWAPGFTLVRAEGHGRAVALRDSAERVRGRAARVLVHIVLAPADADRLLAHFGNTLGAAEVFFWRTPISHCGWLSEFAGAEP